MRKVVKPSVDAVVRRIIGSMPKCETEIRRTRVPNTVRVATTADCGQNTAPSTLSIYSMTRFSTESDLVLLAADLLVRPPGSRLPFLVYREVPTPNGSTDLAAARFRKDLNANLAALPARWAYAASSIPVRKTFSIAWFANIAGTSRSRASAVITTLVDCGLVQPFELNGTTSFVKIEPIRLPATRIFAFEAKLRDWRKALRQAHNNLRYADKSWVIMDESHSGPALKNKKLFRQEKVGLITVSTDGRMKEEVRAITTGLMNPWHRWEVAWRLWQTYISP
ncbi:MAG TPA: hypothetical protein VF275_00770 [Gammaproteobacteria bacterium]